MGYTCGSNIVKSNYLYLVCLCLHEYVVPLRLLLHLCPTGARDGIDCATAGDAVCDLGGVSAHTVRGGRWRPHGGGGEKLPGTILVFLLIPFGASVGKVADCIGHT